MAAIGTRSEVQDRGLALRDAKVFAAQIPELLVQAQQIAHTVMNGWHGRRKRGAGENFWQFRPYSQGDTINHIDWRRSARDDHTYIREKEWEAAHTVWLWSDFSPSMLYASKLALCSKESRALVLTLGFADILSRSGERIAWPQLLKPFSSRHGAEKLGTALMNRPEQPALPQFDGLKRFNEIILCSDFLQPIEELDQILQSLSKQGVRAHLVEVADPAEELFPYSGRTEFTDPETGEILVIGRAETYADDYQRLYQARRAELSDFCKRRGWSYTVSRTDRPASQALTHIHNALSFTSNNSMSGGR
ncbi:uncharacterized protein (DUF58 family) [Paenochrobactrum gallinarii]|uniref:Uncharacterized protein (DUF58 family) n=1 Tax=Paenochrobactrum gallinarii TaxID=643673 RepID=A0A841M2X5_9HYPH|nr:DUF58 domain-containing protein [Paenochrobactrum gallinarii]MBB6259944.1 uncharacterized protein (DUF58 family) [Paenochrobactrum gallinarii]